MEAFALPNLSALRTHEVVATGNSLGKAVANIVKIEFKNKTYYNQPTFQLTIIRGKMQFKFSSKYFKDPLNEPSFESAFGGNEVSRVYKGLAPRGFLKDAVKLLNRYKGDALFWYEFVPSLQEKDIIVLKDLR